MNKDDQVRLRHMLDAAHEADMVSATMKHAQRWIMIENCCWHW